MGPSEVRLQSVSVMLTWRCNLRCDMCDIWQVPAGREMSLGLLKRFLKQALSLGAGEVNFGGGEPLTRKDCLQIADYAFRLRYVVNLATNGALIDERAAQALSRCTNCVCVSVEGTKDCHDVIRGEGSFAKAVQAIKLLRKHQAAVNFNMVVSRLSYRHMRDLIGLAESLDVDSVSFQPYTRLDQWIRKDNWEKYRIRPQELKQLAEEIEGAISLARQKGIRIGYPNTLRQVPDFFRLDEKVIPPNGCLIPFTALFLYPDGRVFACPSSTPYVMGNISRTPLKDIWHSSEYEKVRSMAKEKSCSGCLSCCTDPQPNAPIEIKS